MGLEFTGVTWCPACRNSERVLKDLHEKYHDKGLEIVAITYEFDPAARGKVTKLIADRKLPWPFFFDEILATRIRTQNASGSMRSRPSSFSTGRGGFTQAMSRMRLWSLRLAGCWRNGRPFFPPQNLPSDR